MKDISLEESFRRSIPGSPPTIFRGIAQRKSILDCLNRGVEFYYMDTGYFGNFPNAGNPSGIKKYHRIVKNSLQKSTTEIRPVDRWQALVNDDDRLGWTGWKKDGDKILLIVSHQKSCQYFGYNMSQWLDETIATIKKHTDMQIVIRHKGARHDRNRDNIYIALDKQIFATVAFNSIAAMESIAYGVPAFVTVPCAASPLALTDLTKIATPWYPHHKLVAQHCHTLAYGQFSQEEIANGTAWKILNETST